MTLTTRRLSLRPIRPSDAPLVHDMATSKGVAVPTGHPTPKTPRASRARVGRSVGELGYSIHPRFWGNGYASEAVRRVVDLAFGELGAHRVQATCWVKNPRSAGVLKNAGLRKEGTLRGYLKRGRMVRDEFMFGLARKDRK